MRCSLNPLIKKHPFRHIGGPGPNVLFSLQKTASIFAEKDEEREARLTRGSAVTLRELLLDGRLEPVDRRILRKSKFLFRDAIELDEEDLYNGKYKWLRQIVNCRFFLLNMEHIFPLSCLQSLSIYRHMKWDLVKAQPGVAIGRISNRVDFPVGYGRKVQ